MKLGFDCRLFRGEPGVIGATADIEVTKVKDASMIYTADQVEVMNRSSRYKKYLPGMIDNGIEVNFDYNENDPHCSAFLEAAVEGNLLPLYFEIEPGDETYAGVGLDADFEIFWNNSEQPLNELQKISFTCKPSARDTAREPLFNNEPIPEGV